MRVQLGFAESVVDDDDEDVASRGLGHRDPDWSTWDGGKIGGVPSWLNPRDLPLGPVRCRGCPDDDHNDRRQQQQQRRMEFVCQLYCPVDGNDDDDDDDDRGFHRSLYVFACPDRRHHRPLSSSEEETKKDPSCGGCGGVRVLRCQLPRSNPFWSYEANETKTNDDDDDDDERPSLCVVCGQRAAGKCPEQKAFFCSKECQKERRDRPHLPSVLPESDLVVEEEPSSKSVDDVPGISHNNNNNDRLLSHDNDDLDDFNDSELDQRHLNEAVGIDGTSDPVTLAFHARIDRGDVKDQVLRYQRWPTSNDDEDEDDDNDNDNDSDAERGPLWISETSRPSSIPPCPRCGAPRAFECQIMPQMLCRLRRAAAPRDDDDDDDVSRRRRGGGALSDDALRALEAFRDVRERTGDDALDPETVERHERLLANARRGLMEEDDDDARRPEHDWGVIAVYTCTRSCDATSTSAGDDDDDATALGAYAEEYAWRQPPLG